MRAYVGILSFLGLAKSSSWAMARVGHECSPVLAITNIHTCLDAELSRMCGGSTVRLHGVEFMNVRVDSPLA